MEREEARREGGGPPIYRSATVHFKLPDEIAQRILSWSLTHIPDDWLFDPASLNAPPPSSSTSSSSSSSSSSKPIKANKKQAVPVHDMKKKNNKKKMAAGAASSVFLPPCMRVTEPHVTILGGLREVDFDAIRRDLQADDQPDHFDLQFGRVAVWNRHTPPPGYYAVVVVNVAATKPMNDLFRRLGRHPTQSTSDKGRNNYKPHLTIAYIRKDKAEALLHSLRAHNKKGNDNNKTAMTISAKVMNKEPEEEEGWSGAAGWRREGGGGGGIEFMLNETCVVDSFEFGWRDGSATLVPRRP